jgi:integrase
MGKVVERIDIFTGLYICKYDNSNNWDIKVRLDKKTRRFASGTPDENKAKNLACEKYYEIKTNLALGISPDSMSFQEIAEEVVKELQENISNGIKIKTSKIYISAIKMYHIPFFRNYSFNAISQKLIVEHNHWKKSIRGEDFFSSTLKNHNAALQKIFDKAIQLGHMTPYQLSAEGRAQQKRAHFSSSELKKIETALSKKTDNAANEDEQMFWLLLYGYTEFLLHTGIRTGQELNNIEWNDIKLQFNGDIPEIYITIRKGKTTKYTGARSVVARGELLHALHALTTFYPNRKGDDKVFILPKNKPLDSLSRRFSTLLKELNLLDSPNGRRSLYSYRHTYITFNILNKVPETIIAQQCGTSVNMIQQNYSHLTPQMFFDELSGMETKNKRKIDFEKENLDYNTIYHYKQLGKKLEKNFNLRGYI